MTPIKEPCRVGNVSTPGIIFLGKRLGPPRRLERRARTRSRNRLAFSLPRPYARVPVLLGCPDHTWPARCSRDTAMVAVFRLASSHPDNFLAPIGALSYKTDRPRAGGARSEGRRTWGCLSIPGREPSAGGGLLAAVARTSAATGCEGNETHQRRVRAPVRRASESPSVTPAPDQQRRAFRDAVREERAGQPLAQEHRDKPGASSY